MRESGILIRLICRYLWYSASWIGRITRRFESWFAQFFFGQWFVFYESRTKRANIMNTQIYIRNIRSYLAYKSDSQIVRFVIRLIPLRGQFDLLIFNSLRFVEQIFPIRPSLVCLTGCVDVGDDIRHIRQKVLGVPKKPIRSKYVINLYFST